MVMPLADGTKGRFAEASDPEYDPLEDTMLLQPFDDFEVRELWHFLWLRGGTYVIIHELI
jgi:hypothetical protein